MKKLLITTVALMLGTGAFASEHQTKVTDEVVLTPYLGCYAKAELEKLLVNGQYVALLKAHGPDGRTNEVWVNSNGYTATVAFKDKKNAPVNDKVCVTNVTKNTVYNNNVLKVMTTSTKK